MPKRIDVAEATKAGSAISILALVVAIAALLGVIWQTMARSPQGAGPTISHWEKIKKSGVIKAGYGGFPPYTIVDPRQSDPNNRVSGFSVDLINAIAKSASPPLKVQWVQFSWDTMKADLASGRFDIVGDAVYETIPRATDNLFTQPYSYFGIAVAVVRQDDNRFKQFNDLDKSGIKIALAQGYTSTEYAMAHLKKPKFEVIPVTSDAFNQLDEVLLGRADVALNDVPTVLQYVRAHAGKVKALWLADPPSTVAAGFLMNQGDEQLKAFMDTSLTALSADGTIQALDQKWHSLGYFERRPYIIGEGLENERANQPNQGNR